MNDRGPLDFTHQLEEKDKEIADLKHDNKSLAKQVSDKNDEVSALKMKLDLLDKRSFNFYCLWKSSYFTMDTLAFHDYKAVII